MIGSSTMVVREHGKLGVHIFGGLGFPKSFSKLHESLSKWGKPDHEITEAEADEILHSHQCISREYGPFYSQYAGDCVLLVDLDAMTAYTRGYNEIGPDNRAVNGTEYWKALNEQE